VQDDILDVESDTATLGKRQGADIARDKPTYPALLGLAAKAYALELRDQALAALRPSTQRPSHCGTWRGISSNAATDNRGHCSRISAKFGALRGQFAMQVNCRIFFTYNDSPDAHDVSRDSPQTPVHAPARPR
jgi:hypothetical protein